MFGTINFGAFLIAGILLNITPGTDTMYILSRSISGGKKAGYMSALGIASGSLMHTLFAALGLSVLLVESQIAFDIVKYLGAAYLIYLGIKTLLSKQNDNFRINEGLKIQNLTKVYFSGVLTNILNPKVALFYLAFLPQFIDPTYSTPFASFITLGLAFTTTGTIWCIILASSAAKLTDKIKANYQVKNWLDKLTGLVFISLGIKLALSKIK